MCRVTLVTLGSPGLRAGKSLALLLLRAPARPGRSRTKKADMRIFSKKVHGSGRRGVPAKLGRVRAAGSHGPALVATGVLPVRRPAP